MLFLCDWPAMWCSLIVWEGKPEPGIKFLGGRGGGQGGGSSERCLKWDGGGVSLRDLSKNILKQEVCKGKICL